MRVKEGNKWKAAFTTHVGLFEPVVMFFGMTNSPATFQAMMNEILRDMINEGKVVLCHKPLLSPSILLLFFSFSLPFFSIYSVGNSVTPCDIMRDRVTSWSHVTHSLVGSAG